LLLLLNAHWEPIPFTLPQTREGHIWDPILDSADSSEDVRLMEGGTQYPLKDRSLAVLAARSPRQPGLAEITPSRVQVAVSELRSGAVTPPGPSPI
jgi:glycogen operon protein